MLLENNARRIRHEVLQGIEPFHADTPDEAAYRREVRESFQTLGPAAWNAVACSQPSVVCESYETVCARVLAETSWLGSPQVSGWVFERKSNWVPYAGPKGGKGWKNSITGYVDYGDDEPTSDQAGRPEEGYQAAGAAQSPDVVQAKAGSKHDTSATLGPEAVDLAKPADKAEAQYIADLGRLSGKDLGRMAKVAKIDTTGKNADQVKQAMVKSRRDRMAKVPGSTVYQGVGKPAPAPVAPPVAGAPAPPKPPEPPKPPAGPAGAAPAPAQKPAAPAKIPAPPANKQVEGEPKPAEPAAQPVAGPSEAVSKVMAAIQAEAKTSPPPGEFYEPDVAKDYNGDGVADAARVGVPADAVPPPPAKIPRLPNLTAHERQAESDFATMFERAPDQVAGQFLEGVLAEAKRKGGAPVFETDAAKMLSKEWWVDENPEAQMGKRQTYNTALHGTANAITKRAFVKHLDSLPAGGSILVTVGGCGAGKGYALENVPQAKELASKAAVVWDSAGDQNATENAWILSEAENRGLKVTYAFVHADPKVQWADPKMGVVKRANNPKNGRMVDAKVFADSYAQGARNHHAFHQKHKANPNAQFVFMKNGKTPQLVDGVPPEALAIDRDELYQFAMDAIGKMDDLPPTLKRGAQAGARIWSKKGQPAPKAGESQGRKSKTMSVFEQQEFPGKAQPAAKAQAKPAQAAAPAAQAVAPASDEGWGDALASWYDQEDDGRNSMGQYFRTKGYVAASGTPLPQLNPDGTLAAQPAAAPTPPPK